MQLQPQLHFTSVRFSEMTTGVRMKIRSKVAASHSTAEEMTFCKIPKIIRTNCGSLVLKWLLVIIAVQLSSNYYASATFNLYLDRREFQKLHGKLKHIITATP